MDASAHRVHRSTSIEADDFVWRNGSTIVAERSVALTVGRRAVASVRRLGVEVVCLNFVVTILNLPVVGSNLALTTSSSTFAVHTH